MKEIGGNVGRGKMRFADHAEEVTKTTRMKKKLHLIIQALQQDQPALALEGIHNLVADPQSDLIELKEQVAGLLARARNLERLQQATTLTRAQIRISRWQLWNGIRDFLEMLVEELGENPIEVPPPPFPIKVLIAGSGFEELRLGTGWETECFNPGNLEELVKEILSFRPEVLLLNSNSEIPSEETFDELFCVCHEVVACALIASSSQADQTALFRRHLPQVISLPNANVESGFVPSFFNAMNSGQEIPHAYESALLSLQHSEQSLAGFSFI